MGGSSGRQVGAGPASSPGVTGPACGSTSPGGPGGPVNTHMAVHYSSHFYLNVSLTNRITFINIDFQCFHIFQCAKTCYYMFHLELCVVL